MILRRLGNKQAIAQDIIKYFPEHKIYIEPFFGAGGMFFNKPKAHVNIVNDLDSEVSNLFMTIINKYSDLEEMFLFMPKHQDLLNYWIKNKEDEPIKKALRFLFLSNYTFLGTGTSMKFNSRNDVKQLRNELKNTYDKIQDVQFGNMDFRVFLNSIQYEEKNRPNYKNSVFIYCDPPYLGTNDNYSNSFIEQDSIDLFDCLQATGCKFAMSEFDNVFILNQAQKRCLNVIIIGERKNLKNRKTEILVTNYQKAPALF